MTEAVGVRRVRRTLLIHRVVQVAMVALLLYMTLHFLQMFQATGNLRPFYNSLIATLLLQVALFFPIRKFAEKEALREIAAATKTALSVDEQKKLRSQRLLSDFMKGSVFIFFVAFISAAPPAGFVLSTSFFTCIGTIISYLQNYNFATRRHLNPQ